MGIEEVILNVALVALGAAAGSFFMWTVVGPWIIKRVAPKVFSSVIQDTFKLTDKELSESEGDMFKALTKKQGASFAQAVNGALGNLIEAKPDAELDKLAKQYGFSGVEDAKEKILGGNVGGGLGGQFPVGALQGGLSALQGLGSKNNRFSGLVDTIAIIQALGALGGNGAVPGVPQLGSGSSQSWGW